MKTTSAPLKIALAALLLSPIPAATAALLGEVVSLSAIGEPLRVEIDSRNADPDWVANCLRVSRSVSVSDGLPVLGNARIAAIGRGADARILVTLPAPMAEPAVRLALEDVCETRLRREYVLLLPYPAASLPALGVSGEASRGSAEPAPHLAARPARSASPRPASGSIWVTAPGESPESLALALYPRERELRRRFVSALMRANPGVLGEGASPDTALPAGTELVIPDPGRIATTAPPRREPASIKPAQPRRPAPDAATKPTRQVAAPKPEIPVDRLRLDGADETTAATTAGSGHRDTPTVGTETAQAQEDRLVAAVDRSISMQLELLERIRRLEEIQAALKEELDKAKAALPPPAAAPARTPPALPAAAPAEPAPSFREKGAPDWIYILGAVAVLAAALAGTLVLLGKRRSQRAERPPVAPAPAAESWPEAAIIEEESRLDRLPKHVEPATEMPDFAPLDWDPAPVARQDAALPSIELEEEPVEEHDSAIELAEIMLGFGRVQGAAETLAEFIQANPKQAVTPWLKLLEVYRAAGLRAEFDGLARQLNKTFNVKAVTWETFDEARSTASSVEQMPHVVESLQKLWGTRDCQAYLQRLLRDNRDGTRQGFPLSVIDEILTLSGVLEQQLGPYRPAPAPPPHDDVTHRAAA